MTRQPPEVSADEREALAKVEGEVGEILHEVDQQIWSTQGILYCAFVEKGGHVRGLNLFGSRVKSVPPSLAGLRYLTDLKIHKTAIETTAYISNLKYLEHAYLSENWITELCDLKNLPRLKHLLVTSNRGGIREIKCLDGLGTLETLALTGNAIEEILGLDTLRNLKELHLDCNQLSAIRGLENQMKLEILYLNSNNIMEITGLENLNSLKRLFLQGNPISQVEGLDHLDHLEQVFFAGNLIPPPVLANIDPPLSRGPIELWPDYFTAFPKLQPGAPSPTPDRSKTGVRFMEYCQQKVARRASGTLWPHVTVGGRIFEEEFRTLSLNNLSIQNLSDIAGLGQLENLQELYLAGNQIANLTLTGIPASLQVLHATESQIGQVTNLDRLPRLEILRLSRNRLAGMGWMAPLAHLRELWLDNNQIDAISGLDALPALEILHLEGNEVRQVANLSGLTSLRELHLARNHIRMIEGLDSLPRLKEVDLAENEIEELAGIENLPRLELFKFRGNPAAKKKAYLFGGLDNNGYLDDIERAQEFSRRKKAGGS